MGMSSGGGKYNSEINVTPMVDVMLVLLIIFMVITPLLQSGVNVTLPKGDNPDQDQDIVKESAIVVSVPEPGFYYVKRDQVIGRERLIERLKRDQKALKPTDPQVVYIRGGQNVPYGEIVKAVDAIREAGFQQVGLVADKKKGAAAAPKS
jgi:biopolymer transport protein TolR